MRRPKLKIFRSLFRVLEFGKRRRRRKQMNILLWVLQILLASWNMLGGIYTVLNYEKLERAWLNDLPKPVWVTLGVLQALFALGLVLPGAAGVLPKLTPIAASYLAVNALLGCALFAKYAGFPGILWAVLPSLLAVFVAYGRIALKPF
jgi:hypothetical protein